jgi:hypothetical protein
MTLSCAEAESMMNDCVDEALVPVERISLQEHVGACERCAALLAGLGQLRSSARALGPQRPSRDLWGGIESRIAAPVVRLRADAVRDHRRRQWMWPGVAAALLMLGTAGVTYTFVHTPVAPQLPSSASTVALPAYSDLANQTETGSLVRNVSNASGPNVAGSVPSDLELATLLRIYVERSARLDSASVAVVERNLRIIDLAIRDCRAALAADPASDLLVRQLRRALSSKGLVLRAAVMLPTVR